jgi:hypothetical protein
VSGNLAKKAGFSHALCVEFSRMGQFSGKNTAKNAGNGHKTVV